MIALPHDIATHLPPRGPCGFCGCDDARHRILDAITGRVDFGEDPGVVAVDYGLPVSVVMEIVLHWDGDADRWDA